MTFPRFPLVGQFLVPTVASFILIMVDLTS